MRFLRRSTALAAAVLLSLMASAQLGRAKGSRQPPGFHLVGFTTATFTGGEGVLGFTHACQQQFPNTRMCTSREVMATTGLPVGLTGQAWVRPSFSPNGIQSVDASGIEGDSQSLTCRGWSNPSTQSGLLVDDAGRFSAGECGSAHAVACCAYAP